MFRENFTGRLFKGIVGNRVTYHNSLAEASVLWITETGISLGFIDEIFGPVKNPYYVVRHNSEKDIPAGIFEGTAISFVKEFANHILEKGISRKGYDASGENDEEINDEVEFSDDEKEDEYKKSQQESKRGSNSRKRGNQEKEMYRDAKCRKARFQPSYTSKQKKPHSAPNCMGSCDYNRGSSSPTAVQHNTGYYPLITASTRTPNGVGGLSNNFNQPFQRPNALLPFGVLSLHQSNGMLPYGMQFTLQQVQQQINPVQPLAIPAMQHPNFICQPQLPFMRPPLSAGYQANGLPSQLLADQFLTDYRRLSEQQSFPNFSSPVGLSLEASPWPSLHGAGRGVSVLRNDQNFLQLKVVPQPMQFIPGSSLGDNPCKKRDHTY